MSYDVTALGELLIDFTSCANSAQGNPTYEANPGGAPCNVLAILARLGRRTAFIGKVGNDVFGRQLAATLAEADIDTTGLVVDPTVNTTLAIVSNKPDGDRDFSFFRNPGADTCLCEGELPVALLQSSRIFHFGSLSLTHQPARQATVRAVQLARAAGAIVSFDPNLRPPLWGELSTAREQMLWGVSQCQLLKLAEEELGFLTDTDDIAEGVVLLCRNNPALQLVLVTCGSKGSWAFAGELSVFCPAFAVTAIDTTGAGDTFVGCCLHAVLEVGLVGLSHEQLHTMLRTANAAAGLVTTRKGAIRSMPTTAQINELLQADCSLVEH